MANWFVRINHRKANKDDFYSEQVERKLYFDIDTKKEVLQKIKEDYPEYFIDRVPQRTVNGEFFYANVYELGEYWEKYWLEEIPCKFCGEHPVNRIDIKNNDYSGYYFCCLEHEEQFYKNRFAEEDRLYNNSGAVGFVYKITHKETGKVYIGKTINHPAFRWFQHYKAQSGSYFHEVMKDSDIADWTYEVIDKQMDGNESDLLALESYYISEYDSTNPDKGYNTRN